LGSTPDRAGASSLLVEEGDADLTPVASWPCPCPFPLIFFSFLSSRGTAPVPNCIAKRPMLKQVQRLQNEKLDIKKQSLNTETSPALSYCIALKQQHYLFKLFGSFSCISGESVCPSCLYLASSCTLTEDTTRRLHASWAGTSRQARTSGSHEQERRTWRARYSDPYPDTRRRRAIRSSRKFPAWTNRADGHRWTRTVVGGKAKQKIQHRALLSLRISRVARQAGDHKCTHPYVTVSLLRQDLSEFRWNQRSNTHGRTQLDQANSNVRN
jgi:hypothetical protein